MPLPTILSGANQTTRRGGVYYQTRRAVKHIPTIQLQFTPSSNASSAAAQIAFATPSSGSIDNLLIGMTVYVTPTSDYQSDLINQPENCLKTMVRQAPSANLLYINWTAFRWTTAHTVTVVDNFEAHPLTTRISGTTILKNVDEAYRAPNPRIDDLYATLIVTSGSAANVSPTPSEEAMASGATIASRTWAIIENGVVAKAVSTSATPTFNLDVGTHWLHLTTTDSNGNSNWFAAFIAIVPDTYDSVVTNLIAGQINSDLNRGLIAGFNAVDSVSDLVPGTAGLIFDDITYLDDSTEQVIRAFGWFDGQVTLGHVGDEQYGELTTYDSSLIGIHEAAQHIRLPGLPFKYNAAPSVWGRVTRCTVYDAIWYAASEHSTVPNIAAFDFPASYTNYQYDPSLQIPEGVLFDSLNTLAFFASGGMVAFAPEGDVIFDQSLLYATSDTVRDNAPVYATYDSRMDASSTVVTRPPTNKFSLSSVRAGYATQNTTTGLPRVYQSLAPAEDTPAALQEPLDGIILDKNLSDTNAKIAAGKLTANHFFAASESAGVTLELLGGYAGIVPSAFQWHKVALADADTLDDTLFDTNTRLICLAMSSSYDVQTDDVTVSIELREETNGGENYAAETQFVPFGTQSPFPTYPFGGSPFTPFLSDFETPSATYGDEYDDLREGTEDPTLPPDVADDNPQPEENVIEVLYVPFRGGAIGTSFLTSLGTDYLCRVTGFADLKATGAEDTYNFLSSDGGFAVFDHSPASPGSQENGVYTGGVGWEDTNDTTFQGPNSARGIAIRLTGLSYTDPVATLIYDVTQGAEFAPLPTYSGRILFLNSSSVVADSGSGAAFGVGEVTLATIGDVDEIRLQAICSSASGVADGGGSALFTGVTVNEEAISGDAFFLSQGDSAWIAYDSGYGLRENNTDITHANAFNTEHTYEFTLPGTGNAFVFAFFDPDGSLSDNENKTMRIEIIEL